MDEFVFVNQEIVIFNKPAGMPSHPLQDDETYTAFGVVTAKFPEVALASILPREGGLVHRLDTNTSGLLLFARNPVSYALFRDLVKTQALQKTYIALVQGFIPNQLQFDHPIAHHPKNKKKMTVVKPETHFFRGQPQAAKTLVKPIAWGKEATLVQVSIKGGRRHQIRIHFADAGHPLIGDELYGGPKNDYLPGQALHADTLVLPNGLKFSAPLPERFKSLTAKYGIGF
jgi:23S rRNA pseudouridine1911/1915/1917 synthase